MFGSFDPFTASWTEVFLRLEYGWWQVVAAEVSHRPCFAALRRVNVLDTREWLKLLDAQDAATFRKLLNGASCTNEIAQHWNRDSSDVCHFCSCVDSRFHRFWQCPTFDDCRRDVPSDVWK